MRNNSEPRHSANAESTYSLCPDNSRQALALGNHYQKEFARFHSSGCNFAELLVVVALLYSRVNTQARALVLVSSEALSSAFTKMAEGQDPVRKLDNGSPRSPEVNLQASGRWDILKCPHRGHFEGLTVAHDMCSSPNCLTPIIF